MSRVIGLMEAMREPLGVSAVAIGVFDGVHVGHQALLRQAVAAASAEGVEAVAVTFDRDPDQVVDPAHAAPQLLELEDKLEFMCESGIDAVLVVPFDEDLAAMSPERFLDGVLCTTMTPVTAMVGEDFRFGSRASGDVGRLTAFGRTHGFDVFAMPLVQVKGSPVTSTRIRGLVAAGDVEGAAELLGRPHMLRGSVVKGRAVGRGIGVPTANMAIGRHAALPADGVYAGWVHTGGETRAAAISCGLSPSFPEADALLEAHLLGFSGDLYGETLTVSFSHRIRGLTAFPDTAALREAVLDDIRSVEESLGG